MITAINGRAVKDASGLRNSIGLLSVGEKVDVRCCATASRGASRLSSASATRWPKRKRRAVHPGLEGADIVDGQGGVLIRNVAEGSPAAQRGLRTNDLITGRGPDARRERR